MNSTELKILTWLDAAIANDAVKTRIDEIVARVEKKLQRSPAEVLAWEPIPLKLYETRLPSVIRSSWVFVLRADTTTGAERHPNSHQRMMSYRGRGDFQTMAEEVWRSHELVSNAGAPLEDRWISIPPNVWHQGVVPGENWAVVSFHTVLPDELIEERPGEDDDFLRRHYLER